MYTFSHIWPFLGDFQKYHRKLYCNVYLHNNTYKLRIYNV